MIKGGHFKKLFVLSIFALSVFPLSALAKDSSPKPTLWEKVLINPLATLFEPLFIPNTKTVVVKTVKQTQAPQVLGTTTPSTSSGQAPLIITASGMSKEEILSYINSSLANVSSSVPTIQNITNTYVRSGGAQGLANTTGQSFAEVEARIDALASSVSTAALTVSGSGSVNGNFGIGTNSPSSALEIMSSNNEHILLSGNVNGPATIRRSADTGYLELFGGDSWNSGAVMYLIGNNHSADGGNLQFQLGKSSSRYQFYSSNAANELFSILNSGSVGVGTTTPYYSLTIASTTGPQFALSAGAGLAQWTFRNAGGNFYLATTTVAGTATTSSSALSILGSNGYVGIGSTTPSSALTVIGNITNPISSANLTLLGTATASSSAVSIAMAGNYGYVPNNGTVGSISIFDLTNPNSPTLVNSFATPNQFPVSAVASGRYLYSSEYGSLVIYDISSPKTPVRVGSVVPGFTNTMNQIVVSGKYLYGVGGTNGWGIFDISNPASPRVVYSTAADASGIDVSNKYAYTTNGTTGFEVFDVSNPASPVSVGTTILTNYSTQVTVSGRYAYTANLTGVDVIDISDPTSPSRVALASMSGGSTSQGKPLVAGNYLYQVGANNIYVYNISNPASPVSVGSFSVSSLGNGSGSGSIGFTGQSMYVLGGSQLVSIKIPGTETSALTAHSIQAGEVKINNDLTVQGNVNILTRGLNVGFGGIYTGGALSVGATTTPSYFAGNLGLGTTTPWKTLSVNGGVAMAALSNDSTGYYVCLNTTTYALSTSTTACGASSEKYKENIQDINYGLAEVLKLRPVTFDYKDTYLKNARRQVGFIAEEVATVTPEVVAYDDNGEIQGLDYPKFTAIIVKAVQELASNVQDIVAKSLTTEVVYTKEIEADKIKLKGEFCVDDVCLTKDQFKEMMLRSGVGAIQTILQQTSAGQSSTSTNSTSTSTSTTTPTTVTIDTSTTTTSTNVSTTTVDATETQE